MKIVHVIIANFYKEGMGYQENILPKKHRQLGHDVSIITYDRYNKYKELDGNPNDVRSYVNQDGVNVRILPHNSNSFKNLPYIFLFIKRTSKLFETLEKEHPDIVFMHGFQTADCYETIKYIKKNREVKLIVDNHSDYYNTPLKRIWDHFVQKIVNRHRAQMLNKYAVKFWGVSPWRVKYLKDVYKLPKNKVDLLVMGGDEEYIDFELRNETRVSIREQYHIPQDSFLIVTGGKVDSSKNIHLLVDAVKRLPSDVYLLIFGSFIGDMENYFDSIKCDRIIYAGWVNQEQAYPLFLSADLGCFPGTHSVLWEQACASGLPCLFKDWNGGFSHVDVGGNCILMNEISLEFLFVKIQEILQDKSVLDAMTYSAHTKARDTFSYINIAKKSILI